LSALLLIDIPWFLTEGKDLPLCSSYFPLGVSRLPGHNHHQLHASHHPTMINKNDYVYVGSINSFMQMAHDKNVLCDSYIVNSIHDATESYCERGKHGFTHLNNIKFSLFMLKFLKLHLFCFPMLVALCFHDLFLYRTIFHRKWFRFKFISYLLFDAVLLQVLSGAYVSILSNYYA
jgi:hypothetical protein